MLQITVLLLLAVLAGCHEELVAQSAPYQSKDITADSSYWDQCRQPKLIYNESGNGANERIFLSGSFTKQGLPSLTIPAPFPTGTRMRAGNGSNGSWHFTNAHVNRDVCAVDFNIDGVSGNQDEGLPILAPENATVDNIEGGDGYGHYIDLSRPVNTYDPLYSTIVGLYPNAQIVHRFAHCIFDPAIKPGLSRGQAVSAGQVVCYMGTAGSSSGAHSHYAVYVKYTGTDGKIKYSSQDYNFAEGSLVPGGTVTANTFGYASASTGVKHPNGTYIQNGSTIYYIDEGKKRGFSRLEHFNSWAFPLASRLKVIEPIQVDAASVNSYQTHQIAMSFRPGTLLTGNNGVTIYQVVYSNGTAYRQDITSSFISLGYNRSWVMNIDPSLISALNDPPPISSSGGGATVLTANCTPASVTLTTGASQQFALTINGGTPPYSISWSGAASGTGASVSASFPNIGNYSVTGTVTDSGNISAGLQQTSSASCQVQVNATGSPAPVTVYSNPLPTPPPGVSWTWSLSAWQSSTSGTWITQPVLSFYGTDYRYNHPQQYIEALKQIKNWNATGPLDQLIAQFQAVLQYWPPATVVSTPPQGATPSCYFSPGSIQLGNGSTVYATGTSGSTFSFNGGPYSSTNSQLVYPQDAGQFAENVSVKDPNGSTTAVVCSLTVTGVPPSISGFSWNTQPANHVNFSGQISGSAFTPSTTVWFCIAGTNTCYQHPTSGVTVQGLTTLLVNNVNLTSGSWQAQVRTSYGTATASSSFTVQ